MTIKNMVSSVAVASILAIGFTGCMGNKVSSLTTKQIKQEFVRGKTTTEDVRAKYGDPSEENLITLGEALEMFRAKNQSGDDGFAGMARIMKMQRDIINPTKQENSKASDPKLNEEVEFWAYNDYERSTPSMFNPMAGGKIKGAKLMLIYDTNTGILKDYKFQKFSGR